MTAGELMTQVITEVRALDSAVTRWTEHRARESATTAVTASELVIGKLHRLRDQLGREIRTFDEEGK